MLGEDMGHVFAELHREHGVRLVGGVEVSRIEQDAHGAAAAVLLSDGSRVESDTVVAGIGALPAIDLARDAGLDVGDGVHVDANMRTSDPSIYAVGDIAAAWHPFLQTRIRVEHWATALNQPAAAAAAMLGGNPQYDALPYFYSDQYDLGMEYIGFAPDWLYGKVVVRGDLAGREFVAFWLGRDGRVLAGMNVNVWDVIDDIKALIRSRRVLDEAALTNPDIPLASLVLGRR
jgi:3-phenylpropionate/trans-cinnamate dioxygenase ferredoxin reductase subunit